MGTSTHAENTYRIGRSHPMGRNYLRVRGEYISIRNGLATLMELPPRTRRILSSCPWKVPLIGTTSAYAENTSQPAESADPAGNYLRVRGEYASSRRRGHQAPELPPRTRRILPLPERERGAQGTTSAYAENTWPRVATADLARNYLRVRGEYPWLNHGQTTTLELPPRTRRILGEVL